jgi:hypothetical protein
VKSPRSNPTPNWKHVILTTRDWPDDLVVPQNDPLPKGSRDIQDSMGTNDTWEWSLWRHPEGQCYYLKLWPMDEGDSGNIRPRGAELTVMEAFQFLFTNWMPRDLVTDLICDHPDLVKPLGFPILKPGLN